PSTALDPLLLHRTRIRRQRDVGVNEVRSVADRGRGRLPSLVVHIRKDHAGALAGEELRCNLAHAAAAAGDERDLAIETHAPSSRQRPRGSCPLAAASRQRAAPAYGTVRRTGRLRTKRPTTR